MKTGKSTLARSMTPLATAVACVVPLGLVHGFTMDDIAEAQDRDEELWARLTEPGHEMQVGIGYLTRDAFMFGRFSGLTDEGAFLDLSLDLNGRPNYDADEMYYWRLRGRNLGLDSRALRFELGRQGTFSTFFDFRQMPHNQWEGVLVEHSGAGTTDLSSAAARSIDIEQERERVGVGGAFLYDGRWRISTDVQRETREGTRLRGFESRFGAGAGSIAPELVDYYTDQYNLRLDYLGDRFQGGAAYHFSAFSQDQGSEMVVDGETYGLEPENTFHRLSLTGAYTVAAGTRVSGDLHLGRMFQDDRFPASDAEVTRNDRVITDLDGEIATTALNLRGTHRLTDRARVRAGFRYDDRDNKTNVFEVDGRETTPLSYTRTHYSLDGDYRLGRRTRLSAGVERDERERDFGARRKTTENTVHTQLNTTLTPGLSGGVRLAFSEQSGTSYDTTRRNPVPEGLQNYDIADRDRLQVGAFASYTPNFLPNVSFSGRTQYTDDDYKRSDFGRTAAKWLSASGEVSWVPVERLSLYTFLGWDRREIDLAGQTWTAEQEMEIATAGIGAEWAARPDGMDLGIELVQVNSRARMDFSNDNPVNYPSLASDFNEMSVYGDFHGMDGDLTVRVRYVYQRFSENDWALGDDAVTATPVERDYSAQLIVVSGVFRF